MFNNKHTLIFRMVTQLSDCSITDGSIVRTAKYSLVLNILGRFHGSEESLLCGLRYMKQN